jgi:hypothetical protein
MNGKSLMMYGNKVMRMFRHKTEEAGEWKKLREEELHKLYS